MPRRSSDRSSALFRAELRSRHLGGPCHLVGRTFLPKRIRMDWRTPRPPLAAACTSGAVQSLYYFTTIHPELLRGFGAVCFHRRLMSISVVAYQPKWDREGVPDVGPILVAAAERWHSARFFSMPLVRGTPTGERIFAALNAHGFDHRNMPILDVFCGDELIDTMVLPQGDGASSPATAF